MEKLFSKIPYIKTKRLVLRKIEEKDAEGLQTMRTLAKNMSFLMKSIALGKEKYGLPEKEPWQPTHFIRDDL